MSAIQCLVGRWNGMVLVHLTSFQWNGGITYQIYIHTLVHIFTHNIVVKYIANICHNAIYPLICMSKDKSLTQNIT